MTLVTMIAMGLGALGLIVFVALLITSGKKHKSTTKTTAKPQAKMVSLRAQKSSRNRTPR